mmetsp:Transcript_14848/g.52071  ORF Transcript_14848/g.52071 Transcript_14848/m.52071 type:complete len:530 (-) Transcript_14848:1019-2608(-)
MPRTFANLLANRRLARGLPSEWQTVDLLQQSQQARGIVRLQPCNEVLFELAQRPLDIARLLIGVQLQRPGDLILEYCAARIQGLRRLEDLQSLCRPLGLCEMSGQGHASSHLNLLRDFADLAGLHRTPDVPLGGVAIAFRARSGSFAHEQASDRNMCRRPLSKLLAVQLAQKLCIDVAGSGRSDRVLQFLRGAGRGSSAVVFDTALLGLVRIPLKIVHAAGNGPRNASSAGSRLAARVFLYAPAAPLQKVVQPNEDAAPPPQSLVSMSPLVHVLQLLCTPPLGLQARGAFPGRRLGSRYSGHHLLDLDSDHDRASRVRHGVRADHALRIGGIDGLLHVADGHAVAQDQLVAHALTNAALRQHEASADARRDEVALVAHFLLTDHKLNGLLGLVLPHHEAIAGVGQTHACVLQRHVHQKLRYSKVRRHRTQIRRNRRALLTLPEHAQQRPAVALQILVLADVQQLHLHVERAVGVCHWLQAQLLGQTQDLQRLPSLGRGAHILGDILEHCGPGWRLAEPLRDATLDATLH